MADNNYRSNGCGVLVPNSVPRREDLEERLHRADLMVDALLEDQEWTPVNEGGLPVRGVGRELPEWAREGPRILKESIADLEFMYEDATYMRLGQQQGEISKRFIDWISIAARINYLKNPLVSAAVRIKCNYIFGQDISITCPQEEINAVLQDHMNDPLNKGEFYDQQANIQKETELECDGNLFICFFPDNVSGEVVMRTIPLAEVVEKVRDPEDRNRSWYYKRVWAAEELDYDTGTTRVVMKTQYYPDWQYVPDIQPSHVGAYPVAWDNPIYHIKIGAFSDFRFGLSELFSVLDWSRAYKEFLEDRSAVARSLATVSMQMVPKGGKRGVIDANKKWIGQNTAYLDQATGLADTAQSLGLARPPAQSGGMVITTDRWDPTRMHGMTIHPDEGRRLLLMHAAGTLLPEIFFGDANVGNHATAKTLARPVELSILNRQELWGQIFRNIAAYVLLWAVRAPQGALKHLGMVRRKRDVEYVEWKPAKVNEAANGVNTSVTEVDTSVKVSFPPILERDLTSTMNAIISASTLNGFPLSGVIDPELLARMVYTVLGVEDVDREVAKIKPAMQAKMALDEKIRAAKAGLVSTQTKNEVDSTASDAADVASVGNLNDPNTTTDSVG